MSTLREDVVSALRSLRGAPGFAAAVVLTLALGIGASSAIFSALDAVLLRPLPFPDAGRLVHLAWNGSGHLQALSAVKFEDRREHAGVFDVMATWRPSPARFDAGGEVAVVQSLGVSREFFQALGYAPALGRWFAAGEHVSDHPRVAVISHAMWLTRLGGAGDIAGRAIRLDGNLVTVVGVLPASFAFPHEHEQVEVILPLELTVDPGDIAENWPAIARLRADVTRAQAQARVAGLIGPFRAAYPSQVSDGDRGMTLATFGDLYVDAGVRRALWILMGAVTLVLLIACANVANLFLARAARRRGEIALRTALGATRWRIARLVLAESVVVALAAGALGLLIGTWVSGALVVLTPTQLPRMAAIGIDLRVTLFTFAISLATSVVFGGAAAWPAARARLAEVLNERSRGGSRRSPLRQGLLVTQSALAMVLLAGAGLLVATLIGLTRVDPGFDHEGLVVARFASTPPGYDTSQRLWDVERRVLQQLEGSPVIGSAAAATSLPLERGTNTPMSIDGRPGASGTVEWRAVTPGYFRTLGIPVRAGRAFEDSDLAAGAPVAIVNESFARQYFGGENPIGARIAVGRFQAKLLDASLAGVPVEIVGIVADIREVSLRTEPRRTMYVPQAQAPSRLSTARGAMPVFIARGGSAGADAGRALADAIRAVDPALPGPQLFPLDEVVARSLARERFGATLLSVLAAVALALTACGIYGVLACTIQQRRREIGIRMALGATGAAVARLVMVQGIAPVLVGIVLGVLSAIGVSQIVAGFLWGVTPTDPATLVIMAAVLVGVALAAGWIPAREAAGVDPVTTLNAD